MNNQNPGFPPEGVPASQAQAMGGTGSQQQAPPVGQPMYPSQQGQGQQQAPQQPQQPTPQQHPTVGARYPQEGQQAQQQMGGSPQQVQRDAQQVQQGPDPVLDGPQVPPELRGRRLSEAMRVYNALADDYIQRNQGGSTSGAGQQAQQSQGQQQVPAQGQYQPQQPMSPQQQVQQPAQRDPSDTRRRLFQDPGSVIREEVQQILPQYIQQSLQPVLQPLQQNAVSQAKENARRNIPDFNDLEGEILQIVRTAQPQALANPDLWEAAADIARGRRMKNQRQQTPQGGLQGQPQPQQRGGYPQPQMRTPGAGYPQPQPTQFFAENPTPNSFFQGGFNGASLTPEESRVAKSMGMSEADYMAWKGGVER